MTEPNTLHVAFSDIGTIRQWSREPFAGSVAYVRPEQAATYLCTVLADIRAVTGVGVKPMLSELAAAIGERMGQGWLPIESAPKDGTLILAWVGKSGLLCDVLGFWDGAWRETTNGLRLATDGPTHWQPLPAAPEGEGL